MRWFKGFRFHLSTAFACMIVASEIICLNTFAQPSFFGETDKQGKFLVIPAVVGTEYGWPVPFVYLLNDEGQWIFFRHSEEEYEKESPIVINFLVWDIAVLLSIVGVTAFLLETAIRFQQNRKIKSGAG